MSMTSPSCVSDTSECWWQTIRLVIYWRCWWVNNINLISYYSYAKFICQVYMSSGLSFSTNSTCASIETTIIGMTQFTLINGDGCELEIPKLLKLLNIVLNSWYFGLTISCQQLFCRLIPASTYDPESVTNLTVTNRCIASPFNIRMDRTVFKIMEF